MRAHASVFQIIVFGSLAAATAGCAAEAYVNEGPNYSTEPPKTVLVRVVAIGQASQPEAIAIDGRFVCHNYDPGRRRLPRCPAFRPDAADPKFELEAYVAVGEHRVSVVGWGESSEIKAYKVFLADVPVLCEFDGINVECAGQGGASILDTMEGPEQADAEAGVAEPPPSFDAPTMDEAETDEVEDVADAEPTE